MLYLSCGNSVGVSFDNHAYQSLFLICKKAAGKKAPIIKNVMIHAMENEHVETRTPDRGKEFADHGAVTDKINKRPRKCLGYKTPSEVYYSKTLHLI